MSKLLKNFVGIDISKTYFDVVVVKTQPTEEMIHHQFPQKQEGFLKMLEWLQQHNVTLNEATLFCMEYTGLYNTGLVNYELRNLITNYELRMMNDFRLNFSIRIG